MSDSIRKITTQQSGPRIETGPLMVNDDWTGLFIRGDDCFAFKLALEAILTQREDRIDKLHVGTLNSLLELLASTDHRVHFSEEKEQIAGLKNMSLRQLDEEIDERRTMIPQLIGSLYPPILLNEIEILEKRKLELISSDELN